MKSYSKFFSPTKEEIESWDNNRLLDFFHFNCSRIQISRDSISNMKMEILKRMDLGTFNKEI